MQFQPKMSIVVFSWVSLSRVSLVVTVLSLKEAEGSDEPLKRIQPFQHPTTKKLHNFVTKSTINFFTILGV
jgi:hypothetical protein